MLFLSNHNFLNLFFCFFFFLGGRHVFEQLFLYDSDNFQQILFIERPIGILHLDLYFVYINVSIVAEFLFLCVNGKDTRILTFKYCSLTSPYLCRFVCLFRLGIKSTVVLLPLLGITWLFGVLAFDKNTVVFLYLFAIFNSLQVCTF